MLSKFWHFLNFECLTFQHWFSFNTIFLCNRYGDVWLQWSCSTEKLFELPWIVYFPIYSELRESTRSHLCMCNRGREDTEVVCPHDYSIYFCTFGLLLANLMKVIRNLPYRCNGLFFCFLLFVSLELYLFSFYINKMTDPRQNILKVFFNSALFRGLKDLCMYEFNCDVCVLWLQWDHSSMGTGFTKQKNQVNWMPNRAAQESDHMYYGKFQQKMCS